MPELPEVEALRGFLADRLTGRVITRFELAAFPALKTVRPGPEALIGAVVEGVDRHGKHLDIAASGLHLVIHLARAGWLVWKDELTPAVARPGKGPLALRLGVEDAEGRTSGFDLTEQGTQHKLAIWLVSTPTQVPGIATLGPDPLSDRFDQASLDEILAAAGRAQLKGVLRDQRIVAGIGNAYSDEILHAARLSPFTPANSLDQEGRRILFEAIRQVLDEAVGRARELPAHQLKDDKRSHFRVHARTGQPCPVCGTPIAEVSFADSSLQYCPHCQTGGRLLADRRMSKLLK